ncbi:MAG: TonB family protein [Georgfuchsia sp.]
METKIIVEANKSPSDMRPLQQKLMKFPPPSFMPPPEVQIQEPEAPLPTISNTTSVVAPLITPAAPLVAPLLAAPNVSVACPNWQRIGTEISYPVQARLDEIEGNVLIEFTVAVDGSIKDIDIKSSSNRVFNNVSINAVKQLKCNAQDREVQVTVPFTFKLVN